MLFIEAISFWIIDFFSFHSGLVWWEIYELFCSVVTTLWCVSFDIFREFFFSFIRVVRLCKALVDVWLMWDFIRGKSVRRESWVQLKITNWPAFRIFKIYGSWTHFFTLKLHKKSLKIGLSDIIALLSRNEIFPRSSLKFFASRLRRNCPKKLSRAWDWAQKIPQKADF